MVAEIIGSGFENHAYIDEDGCWIYRYVTNNSGYGSIWYQGVRMPIHRAAWMWFHDEPIPEGMVIHHHCKKRACFNPRCLHLCTQEENVLFTSEDIKQTPFRCGHPRTPENCSPNGVSSNGHPSYRCRICNRRGARSAKRKTLVS